MLTETIRQLASVPLSAAPGAAFAHLLGIAAADAIIEAVMGGKRVIHAPRGSYLIFSAIVSIAVLLAS